MDKDEKYFSKYRELWNFSHRLSVVFVTFIYINILRARKQNSDFEYESLFHL